MPLHRRRPVTGCSNLDARCNCWSY